MGAVRLPKILVLTTEDSLSAQYFVIDGGWTTSVQHLPNGTRLTKQNLDGYGRPVRMQGKVRFYETSFVVSMVS